MKTLLSTVAFTCLISLGSESFAQGKLGTGIFGTGFHANTKPKGVLRNVPLPTPSPGTGRMYIESNFSVRSWNPGYYNNQVGIGNRRIAEVDRRVDHLAAVYKQNRSPRNRSALMIALKELKREKDRLAAYKRDWNNPVKVRFNNSAVEFKQEVVERALRLGMFGKEIHVTKNRDGSKRVILWHGKPNYGGKPQDVSSQFNRA